MFKKLFNSFLGDEEKNEQENIPAQQPAENAVHAVQTVTYDPETLHGTHYTVEAFDTEVAARAEKWIASEKAEDPNFSKKDEDNVYHNYRRDLYTEWNRCDTDQMIRWEHANSLKYRGTATSGFLKEEDTAGNPLLEPVHGISLKDYVGMCKTIGAGVDVKDVCKAMGIENTIWEELNTIWPQRMAEDQTFSISVLFGQYYSEETDNPKLNALQPNVSDDGKANLEKIKSDPYFYEELAGARQAAYEYGLDGAQWILDNYGINLGDFQAVAMQHMTERNQRFSSEEILRFHDYQQEKQKEYAAKFAAEQGGNVADDVEF